MIRREAMKIPKERIPFHRFMQMLSDSTIDLSTGVAFYSDGVKDGEMVDIFELKTNHPYVSWYKK